MLQLEAGLAHLWLKKRAQAQADQTRPGQGGGQKACRAALLARSVGAPISGDSIAMHVLASRVFILICSDLLPEMAVCYLDGVGSPRLHLYWTRGRGGTGRGWAGPLRVMTPIAPRRAGRR